MAMLLESAVYGALGIVLLLLSSFVMDLVIPYNFQKEIFEEKNPAVGALVAGIFVSVSIIIRAAIAGGDSLVIPEVNGYLSSVLYTALGLVLFIAGYFLLTLLFKKWNLNKQIDEHNTALGVAVAGFFVAIAIVVSGAIQ